MWLYKRHMQIDSSPLGSTQDKLELLEASAKKHRILPVSANIFAISREIRDVATSSGHRRHALVGFGAHCIRCTTWVTHAGPLQGGGP